MWWHTITRVSSFHLEYHNGPFVWKSKINLHDLSCSKSKFHFSPAASCFFLLFINFCWGGRALKSFLGSSFLWCLFIFNPFTPKQEYGHKSSTKIQISVQVNTCILTLLTRKLSFQLSHHYDFFHGLEPQSCSIFPLIFCMEVKECKSYSSY